MSILLCYEQKRSLHYIYMNLYAFLIFPNEIILFKARRGSSIIRSHWSVSFLFLFSHTHIYMHACILTYTYLYTYSTHLKILLDLGRTANQFSFWLAFIHSFSLTFIFLWLSMRESLFYLDDVSWKNQDIFFASFSFYSFSEKKLSSHIIITRVVPIMIIIFMCVHNFHLYK